MASISNVMMVLVVVMATTTTSSAQYNLKRDTGHQQYAPLPLPIPIPLAPSSIVLPGPASKKAPSATGTTYDRQFQVASPVRQEPQTASLPSFDLAPLPPPLYARLPTPSESFASNFGSSSSSHSELDQGGQWDDLSAGKPVVGYGPSSSVTAPPVPAFDFPENDFESSLPLPLPLPASPPAGIPSTNSLNDFGDNSESQWSHGSIPWTLEKLGYNTLNDMLVLSGQDETFDKEGPYTVFVPLDSAFDVVIEKFGGMEKAAEQFEENPEELTSLLKHHVVPGTILSSSLQDNMVVKSLVDSPIRVKFYETEDMEWRPLKVTTVNGARIVRADIQATNGVIHIVDRVMFPVPQADIYSTLKNDPEKRYTTLVSAIDQAGLTGLLASPTTGPYTLFAPTDKAFSYMSRNELNSILKDQARLTKLIQRHIVQEVVYTSGLQGFQKAFTLDFETIYIYHLKGMTKVNGANVIDQDTTATNGVIHTIDSVLGLK